ncbi:hypothetical protein [Phytohabitans houttuyneae]|uniref:hypothetical protein n=1 Tax=Phytohabitans houttuyneae TaxID=1076126 RepID=UPI0015670779|nr:hypothetical protein [Phytohabitans houttuyneae]
MCTGQHSHDREGYPAEAATCTGSGYVTPTACAATPGTASSAAASNRYGHQRNVDSPTTVAAIGARTNHQPAPRISPGAAAVSRGGSPLLYRGEAQITSSRQPLTPASTAARSRAGAIRRIRGTRAICRRRAAAT